MNRCRFAVAILAALAVTVQPAMAQQSPYFRFNVGQTKGDPNPNPDPNTGGSLAFQGSPSLPSGTEGTPVSVSYSASGGTPSYAMTLQNAPSGLSIAQTGTSTWTVSGTLTPVGSYQQATVVLSDSAGGLVTLPQPLTVTPGQQQPAQLSLNGDALQSGPVGTRVRGYYTASGGRRPYAMALVAPPAGVSLASVTTDTWQASGQYGQPGTYDTALVKVTDADNNSQTFPIPVTVTANQPLAFTQESNFPPTFAANVLQRASHQVTGGLAPYTWTLASAPQTVVASGTAPGSTDVVGQVPTAGTYSGLTLTVTDATGASVSHVLDTFTVTDAPQALAVTGVTPPPATVDPGASLGFYATVTGLSGPTKSADITLVGAPSAAFGAVTYQPGDPASAYAGLRIQDSDAGQTYDMAVLFTDHDDPSRQLLVPWGKTTVSKPAGFTGTSQFQDPITGVAGSQVMAYAHVKGGSRSANAFVTAPPAFQGAGASFFACMQQWQCSGSDPTIQAGEDLITLTFNMPPPGTYEGVGVYAEDVSTGERVYFNPVTVVSTAPPPMTKVADFPSPQTYQAQQYGNTYMSQIYARMKGGSSQLVATVSAPGITDNPNFSMFADVYDCANDSYTCPNNGGLPDEKLVDLYGYLPKSGSYNATVSITDQASGQVLAFLPVSITITPVPLGDCQVGTLTAMSDKATTARRALTFSGGKAPYTITATGMNATFTPAAGDGYGNYFSDATVASGSQSGPVQVTVKDATNATCTADGSVSSLNLASGTPIGVTIQRQCPYGDCQYQTSFYAPQGSADNDIYATMDIASPYGTGPVGAHPDPKGLYLTFNAPGGATVTGYSVDTSTSPQGNLVLLNTYPYMDNVPWNVSDPTTSLFMAVYDDGRAQDFVMGAYTATYNVYLSDGTYRKSVPVTVHVPQFSPGG